jgi:hypothetical protein
MKLRVIITLLVLSLPSLGQTTIPSSFFGNNFNSSANIGVVTTNGCHTWSAESWRVINTGSGTYSYSGFDAFVSGCGYNDVMLTMAGTPSFASSQSATACYSTVGNTGNGGCNPPSDIGSGDTYRKTFDAAIAAHWYAEDATHKHYYSSWNEPDNTHQWTGTTAQLAQLACDDYTAIHANDPMAVVLSPEYVGNSGAGPPGLVYEYAQFIQAAQTVTGLSSGASSVCFDELAFHFYPYITYYGYGYIGTQANPEITISNVASLKSLMSGYGIGSLPLDVSEGNWGDYSVPLYLTNGGTTLEQSGYMMEWHLLLLNAGISKTWWYQADSGFTSSSCAAVLFGGLWNNITSTICPQGTAYNWLLSLLSGGTYQTGTNQPCGRSNDGTWFCQFTRGDNGKPVYFVWNFAVGAYSQGLKVVSVPANAAAVLNVDQTAATVTSNTVVLPTNGAPIIVEM